MSNTLKVELVAADRKVWEGEARLVRVKSVEGDLGFMPGHQPMLAVLAPGEIMIDGTDGRVTARVDGGFVSVDSDVVTIVAENVETETPAKA